MATLIPAVTRTINDYEPDSGLWWSWSDLSDKIRPASIFLQKNIKNQWFWQTFK